MHAVHGCLCALWLMWLVVFHAAASMVHRCVPEGEPDYNDYMMSHFVKPLDIPDLVEIPLDTRERV